MIVTRKQIRKELKAAGLLESCDSSFHRVKGPAKGTRRFEAAYAGEMKSRAWRRSRQALKRMSQEVASDPSALPGVVISAQSYGDRHHRDAGAVTYDPPAWMPWPL